MHLAAVVVLTGLVFEDGNGDGKPNPGEPGVGNAVVALDVTHFTTTDARGEFRFDLPTAPKVIAWVRVPDGFVPGPVWAPTDGVDHVDLALHRLPAPHRGPLTFVVAADTHIAGVQPFGFDLADAVDAATALDPRPAFFTILGDITQGNKDAQFDLVDGALAGLDVPYIPVPGNHDWYDGGATWFRRYGPDNYSFDIDQVHFVVWNLAMTEEDIQHYLGAELAHVAPGMTIVALTHAPPSPAVIDLLRRLGVDYLLTGHTHSNRVVDHDGLLELATEPLLMGGLDFTPAGYRVITLDRGALGATHHATVEAPLLEVIAPAPTRCVPKAGGALIVAAELDAGTPTVTARLDCGTPIALGFAGGWDWRVDLPALLPGSHTVTVTAHAPSGAHALRTRAFEVCAPDPLPRAGADWPQLGTSAAHTGAITHELAPPLVPRWTATAGGHVLEAAPAIAQGRVYVATTDLANGNAGGVTAFDLATGAVRWRAATPLPVRGGPSVIGDLVTLAQIDGTVLALDAATGEVRWRHELGVGVEARGATTFGPPTIDGGDVLAGNQRRLAAISDGAALWSIDPLEDHEDFPSLAALATSGGIVVGAFDRGLGGLRAWERATGAELWRFDRERATGVNASPVIAGDTVYVVNSATTVFALDLATGEERWSTQLDPTGFDWGNATVGTPALANGVLVVPTLYRDVVGLEPTSGRELWRFAARPGPLRVTHYRGAREAGFAASPAITGDVVWVADTSGRLTALDLHTGAALWHTDLGAPVLGGLAVSGDWLVVATFDGSVRALTHRLRERATLAARSCDAAPRTTGCCDARGHAGSPLLVAIVAGVLRRRRRRATA